jgi:hypothetical protein
MVLVISEMYHHKDYNAFTALIGLGLLDCIIFWKWKHNASSNIVITRAHDFRRKHMKTHLKDRIHGYDLQYFVIVLQLILIFLCNSQNHTLFFNNIRSRKYTSHKHHHNAQSIRPLAILQHSMETLDMALHNQVLYRAF